MARLDERVNHAIDIHGFHASTRVSSGTKPGNGHRHNGVELFCVHRGIGDFTLGQNTVRLLPGTAVVFDGTLTHASRPLQGTYTVTAIHFSEDLVTEPHLRDSIRRIQLEGGFMVRSLLPDSSRRILWAASELSVSRNSYETSRQLIHLILTESFYSSRQDLSRKEVDVANAVVSYLNQNVECNESVQEIAQRFHVSASQLRRLFKETVGYSIHDYRVRLKVDLACRLLRNRDAKVSAVASEVGFSSVRGLQLAFKRILHCSPNEYRRAF